MKGSKILGDSVAFPNLRETDMHPAFYGVMWRALLPFRRETITRRLDYEKYTRFICEHFQTYGKVLLKCESMEDHFEDIAEVLKEHDELTEREKELKIAELRPVYVFN